MLLQFAFGPSDGAPWSLQDLDLYKPLSPEQVAITANGHCFVLDIFEQRVLHFNPQGQKIGTFGKKGQGPGEFNRVNRLFIMKDKLYVHQWGTAHVFDLAGKFIKSVTTGKTGESPRKVANGWLVEVWQFSLPGQKETFDKLVWRDEKFENERFISSWTSEWPRQFSKQGELKYLPSREHAFIICSDDGKRVFVRPLGASSVDIFDVISGKTISSNFLEDTTVAFYEEFGDAGLDEFRLRFEKGGLPIVKDYPDYFSAVTYASWNAEGLAGFYQETSRHGPYRKTWHFDRDGKVAEPLYGPFSRACFVAALRGEWAYICTFDAENEQVGLARQPVKGLKLYLENLRTKYYRWQKNNP